jgi:hypothetical protein
MMENLQGSGNKSSGHEALEAAASGPRGTDQRHTASFELKIVQQLEKKLEEIQQRSLESHAAKTKEVLMELVKGILFDSGLLEKVVLRAVEKKLKEGSGVGSGASVPADTANLQALVKREISSSLSGEAVKEMLDDRFRAISVYLKTEVIPKAVSQALKNQGQKQLT